jgi:hypothetical protein
VGIPVLGEVIRELGATLRQVVPNPEKRAEFELKLAELADRADAREDALVSGQVGVNSEEAKHANLFVAGWRPAVGWCCALALAWTWMAAPLINWIAALCGAAAAPPSLPPEAIYPVLMGMLGLSASRTIEKLNGVASSVHGRVLPPAPRTANPEPRQAASPQVAPTGKRTPPRWL